MSTEAFIVSLHLFPGQHTGWWLVAGAPHVHTSMYMAFFIKLFLLVQIFLPGQKTRAGLGIPDIDVRGKCHMLASVIPGRARSFVY
jgi:hypothetical protein